MDNMSVLEDTYVDEPRKIIHTCAYCKNAPVENELISVIKDNRLYLFCKTKCRDQWISTNDADNRIRFF